MFKSRFLSVALTFGVCIALAQSVQAQSYDVQVGYADNIRTSPFFPMPWEGGTGVSSFLGGPSAGSFDAGAVRIINTGATTLTLTSFNVDGFGDGTNFNIWGGLLPVSFAPGTSIILTQTASYNFDSSDNQGGGSASAVPVVHLTIDGVSKDLADTAQVLNTEGTDHLAAAGLNESHQWRDIGTFGGQGTPEPGSLALLTGLSISASTFVIRRRRK